MKTIEELYNEINESDELKKAISTVKDKKELEVFLKEHGCEATADEFVKFIKTQREGELGDDDASAAAGGRFAFDWQADGTLSWDQFLAGPRQVESNFYG